jgi:hypothetical protein
VTRVHKDSAEGVGFFNRLLDYLAQLEQQVTDYTYARQTEKAGILSALSAPQVYAPSAPRPPQGYGW